MDEPDWGLHEAPASFGRGASEWDPVDSDGLRDVPAVRAATAADFSPAPEDPLWCFVPVIWPTGARAWVRDVRVRHMTKLCDDGPGERLPWSTADYAEHESDTNLLLAELGLPPRPPGRIWLLRAPAPFATADALLDEVWAGWQASGGTAMASAGLVQYTQDRIQRFFGSP